MPLPVKPTLLDDRVGPITQGLDVAVEVMAKATFAAPPLFITETVTELLALLAVSAHKFKSAGQGMDTFTELVQSVQTQSPFTSFP